MDNNMKWLVEAKIKRTIEALEKNNMSSYLVNDKEELIKVIETLINKGDKVGFGGSVTLEETGVLEYLRTADYNLLDRGKPGLTQEEIDNVLRECFFADAYFTSSNAITENGELYNVDGKGNRVAAMIYGPKKVIVIAGINKIVSDLDEAIKRVKNLSAPVNAMRLNKATPCVKTAKCMECNSPDRICREFTVIKKPVPNRIYVIFINNNLGY